MSERNTEQQAPIRTWLSYYIDGAMTGAWQNFPTTRGELEANLSGVGVPPDKIMDMLDTVYETTINTLDRRLPRKPDLSELNHLAARIDGMEQYEREVFGAVMEAGQHCGSLSEIINAADNLDQFDLYPGDFSSREFGGIMAEMHANEHTEALDRLRTSGDPNEKAFASYVERLEASLDLEKYGRLAREQDNGALTRGGYLLLPDMPLPERYTGPGDIPTEHRLAASPEPEPERRPSLLAALKAAKVESRAADAARSDAPEKKAPSGPEL